MFPISEMIIPAGPLVSLLTRSRSLLCRIVVFLLSPGPEEECMVSLEMRNIMTVDSFSAVISIKALEYRSKNAGWFRLITSARGQETSNVCITLLPHQKLFHLCRVKSDAGAVFHHKPHRRMRSSPRVSRSMIKACVSRCCI